MHPGGEYVLKEVAGQDATEAFFSMHRSDVLTKVRKLQSTLSADTVLT